MRHCRRPPDIGDDAVVGYRPQASLGRARSMTRSIADVETFWNQHPLCAFESPHPVGSRQFFEWHDMVRQADEGRFAWHLYEFDRHRAEKVLDVGCGIGWLVWNFARHGADVTGVDL